MGPLQPKENLTRSVYIVEIKTYLNHEHPYKQIKFEPFYENTIPCHNTTIHIYPYYTQVQEYTDFRACRRSSQNGTPLQNTSY